MIEIKEKNSKYADFIPSSWKRWYCFFCAIEEGSLEYTDDEINYFKNGTVQECFVMELFNDACCTQMQEVSQKLWPIEKNNIVSYYSNTPRNDKMLQELVISVNRIKEAHKKANETDSIKAFKNNENIKRWIDIVDFNCEYIEALISKIKKEREKLKIKESEDIESYYTYVNILDRVIYQLEEEKDFNPFEENCASMPFSSLTEEKIEMLCPKNEYGMIIYTIFLILNMCDEYQSQDNEFDWLNFFIKTYVDWRNYLIPNEEYWITQYIEGPASWPRPEISKVTDEDKKILSAFLNRNVFEDFFEQKHQALLFIEGLQKFNVRDFLRKCLIQKDNLSHIYKLMREENDYLSLSEFSNSFVDEYDANDLYMDSSLHYQELKDIDSDIDNFFQGKKIYYMNYMKNMNLGVLLIQRYMNIRPQFLLNYPIVSNTAVQKIINELIDYNLHIIKEIKDRMDDITESEKELVSNNVNDNQSQKDSKDGEKKQMTVESIRTAIINGTLGTGKSWNEFFKYGSRSRKIKDLKKQLDKIENLKKKKPSEMTENESDMIEKITIEVKEVIDNVIWKKGYTKSKLQNNKGIDSVAISLFNKLVLPLFNKYYIQESNESQDKTIDYRTGRFIKP